MRYPGSKVCSFKRDNLLHRYGTAPHEMSYAAAEALEKEISANFYPFFFYNHVEGFYDMFYGEKTEVDPIIQLCIIGVSPAVGPERGDTAGLCTGCMQLDP
jgi:hypothetical protein